ncbi:hypothetical protein SO802_014379 [Lithocarpus litseifolius]|uniref:Cytochrome P450 n=1 Tax=Lithocarpus litseifolius TaxID=425828 RepID=A0AAW2CSV3_9ROSI
MAMKHGLLMHFQLGEVSTVVVSSPEFAEQVMKIHDVNFASRPSVIGTNIMSYDSTDIIFASYGNYWRQLRKIFSLELLSPKRVGSFQPIREELSSLIRWIASKEGSTINLTEKMYSTTYGITSRSAFGKKFKEQEKFISVVKELNELALGFSMADLFPSVKLLHLVSGLRTKLERMHEEADRIMENTINEHKEVNLTSRADDDARVEDLIDVLLKFQEQGGDSEDIFRAGSETSATTVDWAMSEMMTNQRMMKKAQAEVREVFNRKGRVDETCIMR